MKIGIGRTGERQPREDHGHVLGRNSMQDHIDEVCFTVLLGRHDRERGLAPCVLPNLEMSKSNVAGRDKI